MNKQEFLAQLREKLSGLPRAEMEEKLTFYSEMIDDRMEEGLTEEEAVAGITVTEEAATDPQPGKRKTKAWEIVLLVLGSPLWISLLIAAAAIVLAICICSFAVLIALWAVFGALAGSGLGAAILGIALICSGSFLPGLATFGGGLVCAGFAIFFFYACLWATKDLILLIKKLIAKRRNRHG